MLSNRPFLKKGRCFCDRRISHSSSFDGVEVYSQPTDLDFRLNILKFLCFRNHKLFCSLLNLVYRIAARTVLGLCMLFEKTTEIVQIINIFFLERDFFSCKSLGFKGAETNCRIAHNLGILLMNSNCFAIFFQQHSTVVMSVQISIRSLFNYKQFGRKIVVLSLVRRLFGVQVIKFK